MMEKVKKIKSGDVRTASRLIRNLEDGMDEARATMKHLFPLTGHSHVIGITGSPGAGKSTLVDGLGGVLPEKGENRGCAGRRPDQPLHGRRYSGRPDPDAAPCGRPGCFCPESCHTGRLGRIAKAVGDAIHIMDVMGKDIVIVETVGTGQQEVEIINHSHTVIVVLIPGMGDEIQAIKAGILEIADIFVINKADREGSSKLRRELMAMLDMAPASAFPAGWRPPILKCENAFEPVGFIKSLEEMSQTIEDHYQHMVKHDLLGSRMHRKAAVELNEAIRCAVLEPVLDALVASGDLERMVERLMKKETDPYSLAEEIAHRYLKV
jgi:LAO/AO transport system kinase